MRRQFRKQILAASVIAACAGCSRSGHLYSISIIGGGPTPITVPTTTDHFWGSPANYVAQFRVPFDAQGRECHDQGRVANWRTFTEIYTIYTPGHYCLSVRSPIWAAGLVVGAAVGIVTMVIGVAASHLRELLHDKPAA
jgi:hypothetical protein